MFDLDGTLLPLDTNAFAMEYMRAIAGFCADLIPPAEMPGHIMASTYAMIRNTDPDVTNQDAFIADFSPRVGHSAETLWPVFMRFYSTEFPRLRDRCLNGDRTQGRRAAQLAADLGYEIVLATNPLFPWAAVEERMRWADLDDLPWRYVSSLEDSHFCKPQAQYYQEVLERVGRRPDECLMVGNDVEEDGIAARLGIPTYLVTDFLIQRSDGPVPEPNGTMADFIRWLAETRP